MDLNRKCLDCNVALTTENAVVRENGWFRSRCISCRNVKTRLTIRCKHCLKKGPRQFKSSFCSYLCRFMNKVNKTETCWLWTGKLDKDGYGHTSLHGRNSNPIGSHRRSYELFKGEIENNLFVCHSCDIRHCVNPNHLFLGTTQDNMNDMCAKERANAPKLNVEKVLEIRKIYDKYKYYGQFVELSKIYNVSPVHIRNVILRKKWKHV